MVRGSGHQVMVMVIVMCVCVSHVFSPLGGLSGLIMKRIHDYSDLGDIWLLKESAFV